MNEISLSPSTRKLCLKINEVFIFRKIYLGDDTPSFTHSEIFDIDLYKSKLANFNLAVKSTRHNFLIIIYSRFLFWLWSPFPIGFFHVRFCHKPKQVKFRVLQHWLNLKLEISIFVFFLNFLSLGSIRRSAKKKRQSQQRGKSSLDAPDFESSPFQSSRLVFWSKIECETVELKDNDINNIIPYNSLNLFHK